MYSRDKKLNVKHMIQIAMLGAVATVLMLFELPLWFAPGFYEIDASEVAVLIGTFAMGPMAGAIIELIKILLNFVLNGTVTAGVGEVANFIIGCGLIIPAGIIYRQKKSRKSAIIGMAVGTLVMTIIGSALNGLVLLPAYSKAFNMPMEALVGMGTAVNPAITDVKTLVMFAVAPFNLLKGIAVSAITMLLYKKISPIFK
ncbi:MAG: ECF transporter S component [Lachnospiraceae bacterium]|nr:ECF transporter S component [Lachnospiraceae bacterium]